jgi:hypothetical protein
MYDQHRKDSKINKGKQRRETKLKSSGCFFFLISISGYSGSKLYSLAISWNSLKEEQEKN